MDIEKLDINAVCFGILCNFTPVCGEERAKEAVELVRTLQAENEKLRADLEQVKQDRRRPGQAGCVQVGHKWGISMGDCVRIEEYRRTCANCYWHDDAMWACKRPGGWWWDKRYHRCAAFRWRNSPPGRRKGETQHEK